MYLGTPTSRLHSGELDSIVEEVSDRIASLTTKRKRLSGVQSRKGYKMKREAAKSPHDAQKKIIETPFTSKGNGKKTRSPEEQNIAEVKKNEHNEQLAVEE